MSWFIVEMLAGLFSLAVFLLLLFYIYPAMKKEWSEEGRDWRYYYTVCGMITDNHIGRCFALC